MSVRKDGMSKWYRLKKMHHPFQRLGIATE